MRKAANRCVAVKTDDGLWCAFENTRAFQGILVMNFCSAAQLASRLASALILDEVRRSIWLPGTILFVWYISA